MKVDEGGERRVGWRWGLWGQRVVLPARDFVGRPPAPALRDPIIWPAAKAVSLLPNPGSSRAWMVTAGILAPPLAPPAPSQGPSPSLPSRGVLLGARRVRGRVRPAGGRVPARGERPASGRRSELGRRGRLHGESRRAGVAALPSLRATVFGLQD